MAQSLADRVISGLKSTQYWLTEPLKLQLARALYSHEYDPDDFLFERDPLISVYIPTFNRAEMLIERAIKSVQAQTYTNLEIIVAAHGCTDGTEHKVEWWADRTGDYRLRVLRVPRRKTYPPSPENHWLCGPVEPANAALRIVRGSYVARIDDDDSWRPDHIERLLRFAQENRYEFVSSAHVQERDGVSSIVRWDDRQPYIGGTQTWLYRSYLRFFRYNIHCRRKKNNRVNDTDVAERMINAGVRIGFLDEVTCYVLPRPGEKTIGLEAYRRDAVAKTKHFAF